MLVGVLATYASPGLFEGQWRLFGLDYMMLHQRRIDFALEQLALHGTVPGWYPREQLGVPFWSNVQSFPLLPTRLLLLAAGPENLFTLAVNLSACLAALFTFLFARRMGLGVCGSAAAGWTFACCGFFASRVLAGQLGMIESYPALPMLLYVVERLRTAPPGRPSACWALALGLLSGSFALSGHPQLPIYGLLGAAAYALWRCDRRKIAVAAMAMALGLGAAAAQLYPMAKLIGRSSRVLPLDPPRNDIALVAERLPAILFPWWNGAPATVARPAGVGDLAPALARNPAVFWDSVNYLGWTPWLAAAALAAWTLRRGWPGWRSPGVFLGVMGLAAFLLALPAVREWMPAAPFVILRSPVRQMYFVGFALAIALAGGLDLAIRLAWAMPRSPRLFVCIGCGLILVADALLTARHARAYVLSQPADAGLGFEFEQAVRQRVGDGRVAIDYTWNFEINRKIDDVGFFDSIMLAGTYRGLLDLNGLPPRYNVQELNGGPMRAAALAACGVKVVLTAFDRPDTKPSEVAGNLRIYELSQTADRAAYFPPGSTVYASPEETSRILRENRLDLRRTLLLPAELMPATPATGDTFAQPGPARYRRPTPDRIEIEVDAPVAGYLRVLESHDVGWSATVDGAAARIAPAHGMVMAVPLTAPGPHNVVLEYATPGRRAGLLISLASAGGLAGMAMVVGRSRVRTDVIDPAA